MILETIKNAVGNSNNALVWSILNRITHPTLNFSAVWRKTQLFWNVLTKPSQTSRETRKMHYFYLISMFSQNFLNVKNIVTFSRVWTIIEIVGKFWENFEICLIKISLEKLNFYLFLEKLLLKTAFGNTIIFQFLGAEERSLCSTWRRLWIQSHPSSAFEV